jgi:membrane associated rhomboid family serine protease
MSIMARFGFNLLVLFVLIRMIYYRFSKKAEYLFSFFLMGIIIFLLCSLLSTVDIHLGMALGLFAIFAILRFRTVTYTTKDMTYIFTVIGVSVINSQANIPPPVLGALIVNSAIIVAAIVLELFVRKNTLTSFNIVFNNLTMLNPEVRKELLKELSLQTGLNIEKVKVIKVDVVKGNAELEASFRDTSPD